ncbi:MAG TPA: hypothetical protein VJ915_06515, partial [Balneolaceae bacterium]|nr:hypothetical protein [Balneolaceae bacterium]
DNNGRPHKLRLYSVSSPTIGEHGKNNLVSTTVKRTIEELENKLYLGVASNYLADLQPGDKVLMTGPSGKRFLLPENAREYNYLFFATGTGIAPYRGMIKELFEDSYDNDCVLIFGCPYRTDLLYSDFLEEMDKQHKNFHYLKSISREARRKDGSKFYVQSQLENEEELLAPILKKENTLIYICGMKGMEIGIYKQLVRLNLLDYVQIRKDLPDSLDDIPSDKFKRYIKSSDRTFEEVY